MSILKQGEINAIVNNFTVVKVDGGRQEGRIGNNSIHLASSHEHRVSLRTNGLVVYGVYYHGDQKIRFTHDFMRYAKPYVKCDDYMELKDAILTAWEKTFDDKAKAKLEEVKAIVKKLLNKSYQAPEPVNTNTINNIKKEEVKDMNKKVENKVVTEKKTVEEIVELNIMQMAHKIRRELKLEGHYHVQMKIAMNLAWEVKKGLSTIEVILNNNTTPAAEATHTYNAAPVVPEEPTTNKEPIQEPEVVVEKETEEVEEKPQAPKVETNEFSYRVYLKSFKNGLAQFYCKRSDGAENPRPLFTMKARNTVHLDKEFAKDMLAKLIHKCPNNTVIEHYGSYTYLTFCNNEALRKAAESRGISMELGVTPSGDAA